MALADAVGPESHSLLLAQRFGSPVICDHGVTIARRLNLEEQGGRLEAEMSRQAASRTRPARDVMTTERRGRVVDRFSVDRSAVP